MKVGGISLQKMMNINRIQKSLIDVNVPDEAEDESSFRMDGVSLSPGALKALNTFSSTGRPQWNSSSFNKVA